MKRYLMRELKKKKDFLMLTKKEQLRKNKARSDKKLEKKDLQNYLEWLKENHPQCQAKLDNCEHETIEAHHVLFGGYGADKDDRTLLCVCRSCHEWAHKNKANSRELFLHVARANWKQYGGSEDIDNG